MLIKSLPANKAGKLSIPRLQYFGKPLTQFSPLLKCDSCMYNPKTYTVESVTSGHPDKVCDQISDAILDACLAQDPLSRVAVESFGGHGHLVIGGEITTCSEIDVAAIAREVYGNIGYTDPLTIDVRLVRQSPDIAQGVDTGGAGDQGIMYGYATNETPEYLPWAVVKVHEIARRLEQARRSGNIPHLKPDGKTQITMRDGRVDSVLVSVQHDVGTNQGTLRDDIVHRIVEPAIGNLSSVKIYTNPTGKFELGGFAADAGLTGRKIMVDTYCGLVPHGGGAFSGKDATKVDRSAAYMARFAAKNLVHKGYGNKILVSVAYAIGKAEPLMIHAVNEHGHDLSSETKRFFDFRPLAIIERLGLRKPIFRGTATYGHFGKSGFAWEAILS